MKKCLIVTDFQNDFVTGLLGFPGAEMLEKPIVEKIRAYHKAGDDVIFTFDTHYENYPDTLEGQYLPITHCLDGSDGHKLYGAVADEIRDEDMRFNKNCFGSSDLFDHLKACEYESIELVGLVSNICVLANAILAKTAQPQTPVIVDAECTASFDAGLHEATLAVMEGIQIEVLNKPDA